ncbi:MFS transporter [Desulfosporosinus fructosivorans]|uniref:MFS transporter n=1 Tax=Desulfosporosinus fructosivorans TaxID=2018669 RepID=A0A4Z0QXU1_9FIRM|nr:MFS transporter [Desulfosporosinus fructosivorans]TGE34835.1 MFS transporter [Desulfosporosinus fructosivorans]
MNTQDKTFRRFLIIWSGQLLSAIGTGLTAFALGIYVFQKTQSATSYSLIILFAFLPTFILLPFGGVLADRFDRKKMMILGDAGAIGGLLFILLVMSSGSLELWQIYLGVAMSSVFAAIQNPAYKAAVSDLVSEELYSQASGLIQLAGSAQYLISPIIAGFLISVFNIKLVLIIDIMTFLIAVTAVFMIKKQDAAPQKHKKQDISLQNHEKQKFLHDVTDSFRYIFSQKGILWLVLLTSMVCFYVGLIQSLFGPMMLSLTDSKTLGITLSVSASGMLVSSLFIGLFGIKKSKVFILSLFLVLAGLFYALMGVFTTVVLIAIFTFLFFSTLPFVNTTLEVLIRTNVDNERQGRVWSMVYAISQVGYILAFGSAGFLADYLFNPLFYPDGALAQTVGRIIGTGQGRGIGFIFILSGLLVSILGLIIGRVKKISALELNQSENCKA